MTSGYAPKNFHGYLMNYYYMNRFIAERNIDSYGSRSNIARMLERVQTLYKLLDGKADLEKPFVRAEDKALYNCFRSYYRSREIDDSIDPEVLEAIRPYRMVYIYGAKPTGIRFCRKLELVSDILIGDFIAQDPAEVPPVVMGRRVYGIDEIEIPPDAIVVAAVKQMYWEETRRMMEKRNIKCVFHRRV